MKKSFLTLLILSFVVNSLAAQEVYFPSADSWEKKEASEFKIDLSEAIKFAENNEYSESRDLRQAILATGHFPADVASINSVSPSPIACSTR